MCCLQHVSTLFSDFPDRVSINVLVTESASLSLASNRPYSQPYDPIDLTGYEPRYLLSSSLLQPLLLVYD
jgi:hypothetical protein